MPTVTKPLGPASSRRTIMLAIAAMAAVGGFLFGYDTGVIAGAQALIKKEFALTDLWIEVITSSVLIGATIGALTAGKIADRIGRRSANMVAGIIFAVSAVILALAPTPEILIAGRVLIGFGVGLASVVGPLYIAETAPPKQRGAMVSFFQFAIVTGILGAYVIDMSFSPPADAEAPLNHEGWRQMFGFGAIPGVLLTVGFIWMPRSPRWLVMKGRFDEAETVLARTIGADAAAKQLASIKGELHEKGACTKKVRLRDVKGIRLALTVAIGLAVLQQVTGINTVIYYGPEVFKQAGFTSTAAQLGAQIGLGVVNLLFTFVAIALIDRVGRRPLLLWGSAIMALSLLSLSIGFMLIPKDSTGITPAGILVLVSTGTFIAAFAASMGPLVWTVISEIFPTAVRDRCVSIATGCNWIANFIVALTFLSLLSWIGSTATFLVYGGLAIFTFFWMFAILPETKGYTLEEIEANLARGGRKNWLPPSSEDSSVD
jgi:SP family galactose:H+ symporter-like MFS transporter